MPIEKIIEKIDLIEARKSAPRQYIGASIVGTDCEAYLAYSLRGYPEDTIRPKTLRIFALGHKIEDLVIKDLKASGLDVLEKDHLTGRQYELTDRGGHLRAHTDGQVVLDDELYLLEVKSMNDRNWKSFKKNGVAKSHPKYVAQCQMMMGLGGFETAFFIAYNKNTSEYHVEFIKFDEFFYANLQHKVDIVMRNQARKISDNPDDWRCKMCFRRNVCWNPSDIPKSCVTCENSVPVDKPNSHKKWWCLAHDVPAEETCSEYAPYYPLEKE
jgi:hypothetical protein